MTKSKKRPRFPKGNTKPLMNNNKGYTRCTYFLYIEVFALFTCTRTPPHAKGCRHPYVKKLCITRLFLIINKIKLRKTVNG